MLYEPINLCIMAHKAMNTNSYDVICDINRKIRFVGNKLLQTLGLTPEDVMDKNMSEIALPLNQFADKYKDLHAEILSGSAENKEYISLIKQHETLLIFKNEANKITFGEQVIGIYIKTSLVEPLSTLGMAVSTKFLTKDSAIIANGANVITLNSQNSIESELAEIDKLILYLVIMGKQDSQITDIVNEAIDAKYAQISISKMVSRRLFKAFKVDNRKDLVQKAILQNSIKTTPKLLLRSIQ